MRDQHQDSDHQTAAQLLRLCLRRRWDPAASEAAAALTSSSHVDWQGMSQAARRQGLAPLLYHVTRDWSPAADMPPAVNGALRQDYMGTARQNAILFNELERILPPLATAGVAVLLLKGAALAQAVYGNVALRPMVDLDLLVKEKDVPGALRALPALGYEIIPPLAYRSEVMLKRHIQAEEVLLELHWSPFVHPYYHYCGLIDWVWQTALPIGLGQASARTLGPEVQLLHLCGHALLHHSSEGEAQQLWLHDVAEVITHYRKVLDWDETLVRAQQYDLVLPIQHVLTQVAAEYDCCSSGNRQPLVPASVLEQLRGLQPSPGEQRLHAHLASGSRAGIRRMWADLVTLPGRRSQLDYGWRNLFPPAGYMHSCYRVPHWLLVPLYYPYRWGLALRSLA